VRDYQKEILATTDTKVQQRLNALRTEELKMLEAKDTLTDTDIKRAEARLALEKAQLELENSRNAKTSMRLMRGADGTYSYQYVANENKVLELE